MLMYNAELVDVQDSDNYKSLIFRAKRFDTRLNENVIFAESVGISKECEPFIANYKKHIGEVVLIGVSALKTKNNSIFLLATTDLLDLDNLGVTIE